MYMYAVIFFSQSDTTSFGRGAKSEQARIERVVRVGNCSSVGKKLPSRLGGNRETSAGVVAILRKIGSQWL